MPQPVARLALETRPATRGSQSRVFPLRATRPRESERCHLGGRGCRPTRECHVFGMAMAVVLGLYGLAHADSAGAVRPAAAETDSVLVDLDRAISLALRNNPEVAAARSDIDAAAAQHAQAAAGRWPTLRAQSSFTEYRRNQRLYPATSPGDPAVVSHQVLGGDLVVAAPVFTWGRIGNGIEAAKLAEESARDVNRWTASELVFRVTETYYAILAQRRLLAALDFSEESLLRHVETLRALVAERKAAPIDRQRVEVRLAAVRQRRIQEESALRVQTRTLMSLMGSDANARALRVIGELAAPDVPLDLSSETLMPEALARRGDYRGAQALVRSSQWKVDAARAGRFPQVWVLGSYGLRWGLWPSEQPSGTSTLADVGQVGVSVEVPLFDGGRITAEVRYQQAHLSNLLARQRELELRIRLEVESATHEIRAAMERVALSEVTVAQAMEAFRVEAEKQAVGKSTITEVLSAQTDLLDAEAARARSLADANIAVAALQRAIGEAP